MVFNIVQRNENRKQKKGGMSKRSASDDVSGDNTRKVLAIEVVEGNGPMQVRVNGGAPMAVMEAVSVHGEEALHVIMEQPIMTYQMMGQLEKVSRAARAWVQTKQLWARLCYRDYKVAYFTCKLAVGSDMRQDWKDKFDTISQRPRRQETYWKRLYEYMLRTEAIQARESEHLDLSKWMSFLGALDRVAMRNNNLYHPVEISYYLPDAAEHAKGVIVYAAQRPPFEAVGEHVNTVMLRIRWNEPQRRVQYDIVPYSTLHFGVALDAVVNSHIVLPRIASDLIAVTLNTRAYFITTIDPFSNPPYENEPRRMLVSQCIQCNSSTASASLVCGGCETTTYCSEQCAERHWTAGGHHKECGAGK